MKIRRLICIINIKAYNTTQFNIIDLLYLRLGYTVLLEWGHSIYINNSLEEKAINESDTLTSRFLTQGGFNNQKELLNIIKLITYKMMRTVVL